MQNEGRNLSGVKRLGKQLRTKQEAKKGSGTVQNFSKTLEEEINIQETKCSGDEVSWYFSPQLR